MFVSWFKYKKLLDERNELLLAVNDLKAYKRQKERLIPETVMLKDEIDSLSKQVGEYKKLYADELQKRFELLQILNEYENN